ncbi:MAG: hypothetical protein AAI978_00045 [Candidatus Hodgkinia cicadicola]
MFGGLIRNLALITGAVVLSNGIRICLILDHNSSLNMSLGDSLCCSGVCLTVVNVWLRYVELEAWRVSLSLSNLSGLSKLDIINVEPSLGVNSLVHGHIVSGHVRSVVKLESVRPLRECIMLRFKCPCWLAQTLKPLTAVCLNGVSLTLININGVCFSVHLIRYSVIQTAFSSFACNKEVNFE